MSTSEKSPGITEHLIGEVRRLAGAALPDDALEAAKNSVMDWMGVTIAGADDAMVHSLIATAREQGGMAQASVIWHGERTSTSLAALINGSASDSLDFADSNQNMRGHSTPAVVATALAMAEARKLSGLQFLRGVIAGVEAECRVGLLVQKGLKPGFHPTGNIAPFGAAAAAAWLRDLPAERWPHALGIVATQASGLHNSGGTMSKPFHSGKAAMNGVLSASLAAHGFNGRANAIEASEGFLSTHSDSVGEELMREAVSRKFLLLTTPVLGKAAAEDLHRHIGSLHQLDSVKPLIEGAARRTAAAA